MNQTALLSEFSYCQWKCVDFAMSSQDRLRPFHTMEMRKTKFAYKMWTVFEFAIRWIGHRRKATPLPGYWFIFKVIPIWTAQQEAWIHFLCESILKLNMCFPIWRRTCVWLRLARHYIINKAVYRYCFTESASSLAICCGRSTQQQTLVLIVFLLHLFNYQR